jgi:hypothetical protein
MFEYAISQGEGTLLAYGTTSEGGLKALIATAVNGGQTMIFERVA